MQAQIESVTKERDESREETTRMASAYEQVKHQDEHMRTQLASLKEEAEKMKEKYAKLQEENDMLKETVQYLICIVWMDVHVLLTHGVHACTARVTLRGTLK